MKNDHQSNGLGNVWIHISTHYVLAIEQTMEHNGTKTANLKYLIVLCPNSKVAAQLKTSFIFVSIVC